MARATTKSKLVQAEKKENISHTCINCQKHVTSEQKLRAEFYITSNKFYKLKRVPLCKSCVVELSLIDGKSLSVQKFKDILQLLDKPFLKQILDASVTELINSQGLVDVNFEDIIITMGEQVIGLYMKNISMPQYTTMGWRHTPDEDTESTSDYENDKWGDSYTPNQVSFLNSFYKQMTDSHSIETPQHIQSVIMLSKMQLKLQEYLDGDDTASFAKLHKEYQALLQSSGLRPIDSKSTSESAGIKTFSQIFEEIERDGFIKPVPITYMQDIVDRMILYILNYSRKVFGKGILSEVPSDRPLVNGSLTRMETEEMEEYIITQEELENNGKL